MKDERFCYRPIGVIHTPLGECGETPIQAAFSTTHGWIEIFPEYAEGLSGLAAFSHAILVYHFHLAKRFMLRQRPYLDHREERGIFSIRHNLRPNPIGISAVKLLSIEGIRIEFEGADMVDGTPLLDIKPFVMAFDNRVTTAEGWVPAQVHRCSGNGPPTPDRLRREEP
ncbi:MAG: tRNA (N6-threonylcarbamoyladenosine(37)-N6)-methyltransferase TrmO [Methanobacteriota archaeon]|nr:MAG: tRNA (N6-threonylcarbamoyladenosine(37)-N6)-methyltransferase TrmO [Euryarchaeota archaeon]